MPWTPIQQLPGYSVSYINEGLADTGTEYMGNFDGEIILQLYADFAETRQVRVRFIDYGENNEWSDSVSWQPYVARENSPSDQQWPNETPYPFDPWVPATVELDWPGGSNLSIYGAHYAETTGRISTVFAVEAQTDTPEPPTPAGPVYVVPHQLRAYAGHDTPLVLWVRDEVGRADLSQDAVTVVVSTYQGSKQLSRFNATASAMGEVAWTFPGSFARHHMPG